MVRSEIMALPKDESYLRPLLYLVISRIPESPMAHCLLGQAATFEWILQAKSDGKIMAEDIAIFIIGYWKCFANTSAFVLRNPSEFRKQLAVLTAPRIQNAAEVLLLAEAATGIALDKKTHASLTQARKRF
jgi:hypothetical protein